MPGTTSQTTLDLNVKKGKVVVEGTVDVENTDGESRRHMLIYVEGLPWLASQTNDTRTGARYESRPLLEDAAEELKNLGHLRRELQRSSSSKDARRKFWAERKDGTRKVAYSAKDLNLDLACPKSAKRTPNKKSKKAKNNKSSSSSKSESGLLGIGRGKEFQKEVDKLMEKNVKDLNGDYANLVGPPLRYYGDESTRNTRGKMPLADENPDLYRQVKVDDHLEDTDGIFACELTNGPIVYINTKGSLQGINHGAVREQARMCRRKGIDFLNVTNDSMEDLVTGNTHQYKQIHKHRIPTCVLDTSVTIKKNTSSYTETRYVLLGKKSLSGHLTQVTANHYTRLLLLCGELNEPYDTKFDRVWCELEKRRRRKCHEVSEEYVENMGLDRWLQEISDKVDEEFREGNTGKWYVDKKSVGKLLSHYYNRP